MSAGKQSSFAARSHRRLVLLAVAVCLLLSRTAAAQGLTGTLIGTVKDEQGAVLAGARVTISSPALIGGPVTLATNDRGQLVFAALPPGSYALAIEFPGFTTLQEEDVRIGAGATIRRTVVLKVAGVAQSVVVEGAGSRIEARDSGFGTRYGLETLSAIPARPSSMFGFLRAAPGISPTSPSSGTATTVSAFGSGTNENQFLFDGTNGTCPCNGVARSEPGISFIQEVQIQSMGASAEYGNFQGAVVNVITRQGGERFLFDSSYSAQTAGLTSQPVRLGDASGRLQSGYERARYRDLTANLGGPAVRERLWFFGGYQYLRDHDSQPGTDPAHPRTFEQDKVFGKLTWRLTPRLQLMQSFHGDYGINPERATIVTPYDTITRPHVSVPAMTFGHLTHTLSANTLWDVRVGRFVFAQEDEPGIAGSTNASRFDRVTGVTSGAPPSFVDLTIVRTTTKSTISHYRPGWLGADHQWKLGGQLEKGEHHVSTLIPTGVRYLDNGLQSEAVSSPAAHIGGVSITASAFASDAITIGDRLTINAGVRFDHSRAISQDLHAVDGDGRETDGIVRGAGRLYTWNIVSPRIGVTMKLSADGRTMGRASYGRFSQGVLTGELQFFHPGASSVTSTPYVPATGLYNGTPRVVDPRINLQFDPETRAPRTDEFSVGVDREIGRRLAVTVAYVRKDGANFIGWKDVAGVYQESTWLSPDGRTVPVFSLVSAPGERRFRLMNQEDYSLTYNGLVMVVEKRQSSGWQAFGSYTLSRTYGLQSSSGAAAAGAQASTVSPPQPLVFGRDPNDLTNARGRLPNDRPHMFRVMGSVAVPRTGVALAANLQHFSGKPWARSAIISLQRQGDVRVLLEPRGSQRLSSQTLLDVRVSRPIRVGNAGRVELLLDVFNLLNDTAEEGLATDNLFGGAVPQPTVFIDPRRAMISVRLNLGR
jgi:hypothetical protein